MFILLSMFSFPVFAKTMPVLIDTDMAFDDWSALLLLFR
jgi:hypothetical protein